MPRNEGAVKMRPQQFTMLFQSAYTKLRPNAGANARATEDGLMKAIGKSVAVDHEPDLRRSYEGSRNLT
jgi:hypothetical protein